MSAKWCPECKCWFEAEGINAPVHAQSCNEMESAQ